MSPEIVHAHSLLKITPNVSDEGMRSAWRKLVRQYHPDLAETDPEEASRRMAEINAAFDVVSHHRSLKQKKEDPKKQRQNQAPRAARRHAQRDTQSRQQRDAHAKTATEAKREAFREARETHATTPKPTVKRSHAGQTLPDAARAVFEETRRKLRDAARRPAFSAFH